MAPIPKEVPLIFSCIREEKKTDRRIIQQINRIEYLLNLTPAIQKEISDVKCKTPTEQQPFYMVFVEGSTYPPSIKHDDHGKAFEEAMRLAIKENKRTWVMCSVTEVKLTPHITQFKVSNKLA